MTAMTLLADLSRRGVVLTPRGSRLGYDAPRGVLTEADRAALAAHKAAILELMTLPPEAAPSGPASWLAVLPRWADPWRERWGRRSVALQEAGHGWHEADRIAFEEVQAEREAAGDTAPAPWRDEGPDPTLADFDRSGPSAPFVDPSYPHQLIPTFGDVS